MSANRTTTVEVDVAARPASVRPSDRISAWLGALERPAMQRGVLMLAVLLCIPTIFTGFALDDYILLERLAQPTAAHWSGSAPFDLFRWLDPEHNPGLIDGMGMPWWTFEGARCAFFRPLASLSHALDYSLFPRSPALMHVHNLLWFALLLWLAAKAYGELIDNRLVAAVSIAMFAVDSARGSAVCWISNRNALIAGALSVAALLCHQRAQRNGSIGWACAAWLYFSLALLGGELAVGVVGYLVSYALICDRNRWIWRAASLAPYLVISSVWAVARSIGQYGSFGIGAYTDPLAEPSDFLRMFPQRWVALMAAQIGRMPADIHALVPVRFVPFLAIVAALGTLFWLWFMWPTLRRRRTARFFALGTALCAVPLAATIPADRLLMLVGFGAMPPMAWAACDALESVRGWSSRSLPLQTTFRRSAALVLAGVHLVVEPMLLPITALSTGWVAHWTENAEVSVPFDSEVLQQAVIVAAVPDSVLLTYTQVMREWEGKPRPDKLYWLTAMPGRTQFERRSEDTLRVSAAGGLFDRRSEARGSHFPLRQGDEVVLSELTIHVLELNEDGLPSVCDFVFNKPLESDRYRWQTWEGGKLQPFTPPKVGESAVLVTSADLT